MHPHGLRATGHGPRAKKLCPCASRRRRLPQSSRGLTRDGDRAPDAAGGDDRPYGRQTGMRAEDSEPVAPYLVPVWGCVAQPVCVGGEGRELT